MRRAHLAQRMPTYPAHGHAQVMERGARSMPMYLEVDMRMGMEGREGGKVGKVGVLARRTLSNNER